MNPRSTLPNPFDADVVVNPDLPSSVDVREIHRKPFEDCCAAYEKVVRAGASFSVLFFGEAGCGKTHLLSRFRRWLSGTLDTTPSAPPAAFIAVRMETAPSQVWRHLRRRAAETLLQPAPDGRTLLDAILDRFLAHHPGATLEDALDQADCGFTLHSARVLDHFAAGRARRLSKAWLKGDALSERDLQTLDLSAATPEDTDDESSEGEARRFVVSLAKLCRPHPVVFCFDQIEALGLAASSAHSFATFTRLGATLVDETPNSLVVSSVLSQYLDSLKTQASDYARISKTVADLQPLDWPLGQRLIEARLDAFEELAPHRPRRGIAPLDPAALKKVFDATAHCPARKLIHEARRLFALWQGAEAAPRISEADFLTAELLKRQAASVIHSDPAAMDEILAHGLRAVGTLTSTPVEPSTRHEIDFSLDTRPVPILVALCNQRHGGGLFHKLNRLRRTLGDAGQLPPLCLVRDPRLTVPPTARKATQLLDGLLERGARLVRPVPDAVAAIDAIRQLLSSARSGDLGHQGEALEESQVLAWLRANLPHSVRDLVDDLQGGSSPPQPEPLFDLLRSRKVIAVEEAAAELGWPPTQVVDYARAYPDQAGLLEGPSPVVFYVLSPVAGDSHDRP